MIRVAKLGWSVMAIAGLLAAGFWSVQNAAVAGPNSAVVVELFTSEGCSSCPPADALLRQLKHNDSISGANVIALEEHVDYWNSKAWMDPFSTPTFTARENDYAHRFGEATIYTPEMVVDGRSAFVGSDRETAISQIGRAAKRPKASVTLSTLSNDRLSTTVTNIPTGAGHKLQVFLAMTEDDLTSHPSGGENGGTELVHSAIVRRLTLIGTFDPANQPTFSANSDLKLLAGWNRRALSAVVFVQDPRSGAIVGSASAKV
jgi:hypothetical protein